MKKIIISLVRLYQKKAPYHIRSACRFEPTCSEYMILAVQRYGCFKGVLKGIRRLLRCKPPNGGVDYP